mmetsp:Transcript_11242/g.48583  ORF Transcript_11242/g.48583 Transcript_11242/m.48583 type:complete len:327 (-) Transcript_11242:592-1572(-)
MRRDPTVGPRRVPPRVAAGQREQHGSRRAQVPGVPPRVPHAQAAHQGRADAVVQPHGDGPTPVLPPRVVADAEQLHHGAGRGGAHRNRESAREALPRHRAESVGREGSARGERSASRVGQSREAVHQRAQRRPARVAGFRRRGARRRTHRAARRGPVERDRFAAHRERFRRRRRRSLVRSGGRRDRAIRRADGEAGGRPRPSQARRRRSAGLDRSPRGAGHDEGDEAGGSRPGGHLVLREVPAVQGDVRRRTRRDGARECVREDDAKGRREGRHETRTRRELTTVMTRARVALRRRCLTLKPTTTPRRRSVESRPPNPPRAPPPAF